MASAQEHRKLADEKDELQRRCNKLESDNASLDQSYQHLEGQHKSTIKELDQEKRKHAETKESFKKVKDADDSREEYIADIEKKLLAAQNKLEEQKVELSTSQRRIDDARVATKEAQDQAAYYKNQERGSSEDVKGVRELLLAERAKVQNLKAAILTLEANAVVNKDAKEDLLITRSEQRGIDKVIGQLKDDLAKNGFNPSPHAYLPKTGQPGKPKPAKTLEEEISGQSPTSHGSGFSEDVESGSEVSSEVSSVLSSSHSEDEDDTIKIPASKSPKRRTSRPHCDSPPIIIEGPGPEKPVTVEGPERIVEVPGPPQIVYRQVIQPHVHFWHCWSDLYLGALATVFYFTQKRADVLKRALINISRAQQAKNHLTVPEPDLDPGEDEDEDYVRPRHQVVQVRMNPELNAHLADLSPLPRSPDEREQLPGEVPPPDGGPDLGPVMFSSQAFGSNMQNIFEGLEVLENNDDAREQLPGDLPSIRRKAPSLNIPYIPGPSYTSSKPLTWSRDSILHPSPSQLPPFKFLFWSLVFHFLVYWFIFQGIFARKERMFWMDANDATSTFLYQLIGGKKNPYFGIEYVLGTVMGEGWRRTGEIWVWKYLVRAWDLEVNYALPG
jgi:hypothetical protein